MTTQVFLYCRKSSESEDRQVLSLQSQINELTKFAKKNNLKIIGEPITESMSAKAPGRPKFNELMDRLDKKEAQGVLCWKLDRLARNAVDGGRVTYLVSRDNINIYTPSQTFSKIGDNIFMMYIEFGMAQKFVDDLGKNAQRGMKTKAELGWYPAPAPLGYSNTPGLKKGFKIIEKDPLKFEIVKKIFSEILNGKDAMSVWKMANTEWKLTGKSDRLIAESTFYNLLTSPFYYGEYEWPKHSGNWYHGNHEPMISQEQFDHVQVMLGRKGKPIAKSHQFDLTGLFRCPECNSAITATKKKKYYKTTNNHAVYVYYHCTKKRNTNCSQKPITELQMNEQISNLLGKLRPDQAFITWARKWIQIVYKQEYESQEAIFDNQTDKLKQTERKLNNLLDMKLDEKIDELTYSSKKAELEKELHDLQGLLSNSHNSFATTRTKIENAIDLANTAQDKFTTGKREEKHDVLLKIGKNLELENQKIQLHLYKHFQTFFEQEKWEENFSDSLEPTKYTDILSKNPDLRPANPAWLRVVDDMRTYFLTEKQLFPLYMPA